MAFSDIERKKIERAIESFFVKLTLPTIDRFPALVAANKFGFFFG